MYSAVNRGVTPVSFEQECCNYIMASVLYRRCLTFFLSFSTLIEATKNKILWQSLHHTTKDCGAEVCRSWCKILGRCSFIQVKDAW